MTSDEMIADLREAFARRATDITGDSATSVAQRVRVRPDTRRLDAVGIAALSIAVTALTVIGFLAVNTDRKPIPAAKSRPPVG